jgi:hypothetical protein
VSVRHDRALLIAAWATILVASNLPEVLWSLVGPRPSWLSGVKLTILLVAVLISHGWQPLHRLHPYFVALLAVFCALRIQLSLVSVGPFRDWAQQMPWALGQTAFQLIRVILALAVAGLLLWMGYKRQQIYLVRGNPDAIASPVPWLGQKQATPWRDFARLFIAAACLATFAFMVLGNVPRMAQVLRAMPLLPAAAVMAGLNALDENILLRAVLLGAVEPVVGRKHALLMAAVNFGLAHWYSAFGGLPGVLLAGFLGWINGKAILETRGLWWAWLIQFPQDWIIFFFYALAAVR